MAAIEFEEVEIAFDLFYLISYGHLDANAQYDSPDWNKVDKAIVNEMMQQNLLGFDVVDLYCVRLDVDTWEIVGARSDEEARGYFLNKYRALPKIIKMGRERWLKEFYFPDSKETKSLMELRKQSNVWPRQLLIY